MVQNLKERLRIRKSSATVKNAPTPTLAAMITNIARS